MLKHYNYISGVEFYLLY